MIELAEQILVGDHVGLSVLESKDASTLFRLIDRNRSRLKPWLPWVEATGNAKDSLRFIERAREDHGRGKALHLGIYFRGRLAGMIGLREIDWANLKTSIGYWIGAEFSGRGLVTMSCRALVDYSFKELKLHRLEIRAAPGNLKSRAIPKKLKFSEEGILRESEKVNGEFIDHVVYSILVKEWGKE